LAGVQGRVAANAELVAADLEGIQALSDILMASVPDNWPPELYDRESLKYSLRQLEDPAEQCWSSWYLLSGQGEKREVLGICGFKGRPDQRGTVEIGYSILSQFRNQGFATEAVERLLGWAFSHQSVAEVCAETLPHLQQSIRVMKKNGFSFTGAGSELGVVRYAVQRPDRR
jgi:RimJ/RimL family protein N-acetyltransferase